jgi:hypothetical protein
MGRKKISFDEVILLFKEKKCQLLCSKQEFELNYINSKTKLKYNALCGHEHYIQLRIFKSNIYKPICPNCVYKERSVNLKKKQSDFNKLINNKTETESINYLISIIEPYFDVIKTFDSCKSDLIVKPKNVIIDLWLGIQLKSTASYNDKRNCYYFNIKKNYNESIIICISNNDKKMWMFEYNQISHIKSVLQICNNFTSKYNTFEIKNDIYNYILDKYNNNKNLLFEKNYLLNQLSKTTLVEYKYRMLRENKINFITFINNENAGEVFDFKVGNKKIQEKVAKYIGNINNKVYNYYNFNLSKCNGKHNKKIPYEKGDNDIYWFNCKDEDFFYVIPENILIEYGFIEKRISIQISNENKNKKWLNEFKFDYNNLDKEKLCKILL